MRGVIAAGHPRTAEAGADVLRAGGNAVDAAIAAVSMSLYGPSGEPLRTGEVFRNPEAGDALERLGREGADPFYRGDVAAAVLEWLEGRGAMLTAADLAGYRAVPREPVSAAYRGREVLTN